MNRRFALCLTLLLTTSLFGSEKNGTDAENMGFLGHIKSVSTKATRFMQVPTQPAGPAIVYHLPCMECEFDKDGYQVKNGSLSDGEFHGSFTRRIRDEQGNVQEEVSESEKGDLVFRHVYTNSPTGRVQDDVYGNDGLSSWTTFRYDNQGNVVESNVYKADGRLEEHHETIFGESRLETLTEEHNIYWRTVETYNPQTGDRESFTTLNRDGSVQLRLGVQEGRIVSVWQEDGNKPTYGSGVVFEKNNLAERDSYSYDWDGIQSTTHYTFTDETRRFPLKVTLYDTQHSVVMGADYEYEFDALGNWTRRTVWVRTRESGGNRQLLEKDTRTLTYYSER